ncbi:MAG TPA: alpha-L-rhamnosidase C-terminal domain-containing protein, partial [Puia sp.]
YYLGVRPLSAGYTRYVVAPVLGGLEWMEGEAPTPHGNIKVYCSRTKMVVHAVEGRGVLQFRSRVTPTCKEGNVRKMGGDRYEVDMEGGHEYTVNYKE